jgi:hypothetical protein
MKNLFNKFGLIGAAALCMVLAMAPAAHAKATEAKAQPAPAAEKSLSREDIQRALMTQNCYVGCVERIQDGVIPRSEGMACMDLCVSDSLAALFGPGRITGQVYVKFADGRIEKALKIPVRILSLDHIPSDAPKEAAAMRDGVIALANKPLAAKKSIACASSDDYGSCGLGMEQALAGFTISAGFTDIDNGVFSVSGIPEGSYVLWVDWFRPNASDVNTGSLYRWLIPVLIGEQKKIAVELNEKNISYIMLNLPRSMFSE